MGIKMLIERLNQYSQSLIAYKLGADFADACMDAATALSTLQAENAEMEKQLNEFSKFLCHMTGNLLSKTNYTAKGMIAAAEDYQQKVCDNDCDLRADLEQERAHRIHAEQHADAFLKDCERLDADLARVTAERDGAIKDLNEFLSMDELCPIQCEWCKWNGTYCDGKTPEWRGIKKEED